MNATEGMFLTREEIEDLTGRARPTAQIRWLRANGFEVLERADGMPIVLRAALMARMGVAARNRRPILTQPDWSILNDQTSKT